MVYCLSQVEADLFRADGHRAIALTDFEANFAGGDLKARVAFVKQVLSACEVIGEFDPNHGISFREHISSLCGYRIERALRVKSGLDSNFFSVTMRCYSEVFKLAHSAPDAGVLVLDVNSMFPWILSSMRFPDPRALVVTHENVLPLILSGKIDNGLFQCQLKVKPTHRDFISSYGPFWAGLGGDDFPIDIEDHQVKVGLHACEIKALAPYLDIEVLSGTFSRVSIGHPLASMAIKLYEMRTSATGILKAALKCCLTTMHASTMRQSKTSSNMASSDELMAIPGGAYSRITPGGIKGYRIDNDRNLYSLTSTVFAHARAHMLQLLADFHSLRPQGVEVTYANIDSLHLVVPDELRHSPAFLDLLKKYVSPALGHLKIECEGRRALWLSPGNYLVVDENNKIVKSGGNWTTGDRVASTLTHRYMPYFDYNINEVSQKRLDVFRSLSHEKQLSNDKHHFQRIKIKDSLSGSYEKYLSLTQLPELKQATQDFFLG